MPKFKVLIEEVVQYVVLVEAEDLHEAGDKGLAELNASKQPQQFYHATSERTVGQVYKGDGPLPPTC